MADKVYDLESAVDALIADEREAFVLSRMGDPVAALIPYERALQLRDFLRSVDEDAADLF